MNFSYMFSGHALNAVDQKGRVSLPADIRATIERRATRSDAQDLPVDDKLIFLTEDDDLPCLVGIDEVYQLRLAEQMAAEGQLAGERSGLISRNTTTQSLISLQRVVFDKAGRMVLNPMFRKITGIKDHAFFAGSGEHVEIWEPKKAHAHFTKIGERKAINAIEYLCEEKGVAL